MAHISKTYNIESDVEKSLTEFGEQFSCEGMIQEAVDKSFIPNLDLLDELRTQIEQEDQKKSKLLQL